MADMYLGGSAEMASVSGRGIFGTVFNWTGALMSVALVGGLGVWGYQLAVRDVAGVPVVRALEGPMRVTPDDPGGDQADHQGFAVNNVAAEGVAEGPAERLVLAPPPLDLAEEDLPAPRLAGLDALDEQGFGTDIDDEVVAYVDELTEGVTPLSAPLDAIDTIEDVQDETAAAPLLEVIPASVKGVAVSPIPIPRPAGDPTAEAVAESVAGAIAAPAVEIAAAEVPEGARLVQFGAFASPEEARSEWARLDERFTDFLTDKQRVIEKAVSGGKTFYRLRAMGFADISDARRFCSTFVADGKACIPVVAR